MLRHRPNTAGAEARRPVPFADVVESPAVAGQKHDPRDARGHRPRARKITRGSVIALLSKPERTCCRRDRHLASRRWRRRLAGVLSNQDVARRLARATGIVDKRSAEPSVRPQSTVRPRIGRARQAILGVLAEASAPMTPTQVHAALRVDDASYPVPYATVKSALSIEANKPSRLMERCPDGGYRMMSDGALSRAGFHGDRVDWFLSFKKKIKKSRDPPYRSGSESRTRPVEDRRGTRAGARR
jgi:hypothetical protein